MPWRFSRRAVALEGEVGAGDPVGPLARADGGLTVIDVVNLIYRGRVSSWAIRA
jgi:hypothetical protein